MFALVRADAVIIPPAGCVDGVELRGYDGWEGLWNGAVSRVVGEIAGGVVARVRDVFSRFVGEKGGDELVLESGGGLIVDDGWDAVV